MKNATKLLFASTLALAALASNFANAAYLQNYPARTTGMASHVASKHNRALDSMAYAPADFGGDNVRDFGISSQR
jgi:hypothetical protein